MVSTTRARRQRRNTVIRATLALLAALGIGLGLTSALWSDNVWFQADVKTASFNLQGSVTDANGGWKESSQEDGIELTIPSTVWDGLEPGDVVSTTVWVKNAGTSTAVLAAPVFTLVNPVADLTITDAATGVTVTSTGITDGALLNAGDVVALEVTLTAGADLVPSASGTLIIHVAGTSQP